MTSLDILGLFAAALTSLSFIPQALKALRTRDTAGISLWMYGLFVIGVGCWLVWGVLQRQMPVVVANGLTFVFAALILGLKLGAVLTGRERP
jgi:MtN3 and saliva related transmembrane protein